MDKAFLILLTGHLLGDFVFQTDWMVERKKRMSVLTLHVAIVVALTAGLFGGFPWMLLAILGVTHLVMDVVKARLLDSASWFAFAVDQFVHLGVLFGLAFSFPDAAAQGYWLRTLSPDDAAIAMVALTGLCAIILGVPVGGVVIALLIRSFLDQIRDVKNADDDRGDGGAVGEADLEGLKHGGKVIGWLERGLVLLLVLAGQPGGVGFIVAAKSILRYGDIKDGRQRRLTEYVISGTFLSFGWALLIAFVAAGVIAHWRS